MAASAWEGFASHKDKSLRTFKCSLNWNVFLENWVIPGCKFWAACRAQTDLCQRRKKIAKKTKEKKKSFSQQMPCFLLMMHWVFLLDSFFNSCSGLAVWLYPSMWLSLPSPYQCPLKPSFPVGSRQNWMKDTVRSLLGPGLEPARAHRATLDTSPFIKNQTESRTHSIPTAERNNVVAV